MPESFNPSPVAIQTTPSCLQIYAKCETERKLRCFLSANALQFFLFAHRQPICFIFYSDRPHICLLKSDLHISIHFVYFGWGSSNFHLIEIRQRPSNKHTFQHGYRAVHVSIHSQPTFLFHDSITWLEGLPCTKEKTAAFVHMPTLVVLDTLIQEDRQRKRHGLLVCTVYWSLKRTDLVYASRYGASSPCQRRRLNYSADKNY